MIFSLVIYAPPSSESGLSALQFATAAINSGHGIYRVFFYHEGVRHGSGLSHIPQDELDISQAWGELKDQNSFELCICIAASVKRGIFTREEALRYELDIESIDPSFSLVGLGDLVDATEHSDRLLSFGAS